VASNSLLLFIIVFIVFVVVFQVRFFPTEGSA